MKTTGNTILITGGTSGIGQAFAERFAQLGNKVIICGRREERLSQMKAQFPDIEVRTCDVSDATQREELAAWAIQNFPSLNILINNAGVQLATDLSKPVDLTQINQEIGVNLIAPIHLTSLFAAQFMKQEDAALINISSGLAFVPIAFMPVYCATKAAIHSLTLSTRHQFRNTSVKVFEIAPPSVDTELGHERRSDPNESHGGLPVSAFLEEAMMALEHDTYEAPIAHAKNLHAKRESAFEGLNAQFG